MPKRAKPQPSSGSYQGPSLTPPALGQPITAASEHAYRTRAGAERQADRWNDILEHDPILGPSAGFRVGVAPLVTTHGDGPRWDLIWISADRRTGAAPTRQPGRRDGSPP